jgi:hypothetical protein
MYRRGFESKKKPPLQDGDPINQTFIDRQAVDLTQRVRQRPVSDKARYH